MEESQPRNANMDSLQRAQNKMLRTIENVKLTDKVRSADMRRRQNILSVNQTMAQIKITEMWKATSTSNMHVGTRVIPECGRITRSNTNGDLNFEGFSTLSQNSCVEDAKRVWNKVPGKIKEATSIYTAKKEIKAFCATLPI